MLLNPCRKKGAFLFKIWQHLSLECPKRRFFANQRALFCGVTLAPLVVTTKKMFLCHKENSLILP
jgi:hypothetical protein